MLSIKRQILYLFKTLARRAGVKPSQQQQAPQLLLQSDTTGSKLITAAHDVRLEYAWPETSPERVSWPLGWNLLEECGAKQPDSVTLAPDGTVEEVRLVYADQLVAKHPRCWDRERTFFEPIHYLALLERKPGGLDYARPLEQWHLAECYALLRRRLEAADPQQGTRSFIRVLRLLEKFTLAQLTAAIEYALDIDVLDADSIRTIVEHRSDQPVELFPLAGRPHLAHFRVETTDVSAYQALLGEVTP